MHGHDDVAASRLSTMVPASWQTIAGTRSHHSARNAGHIDGTIEATFPKTRHASGVLLQSNENRRTGRARAAGSVFWAASQGRASGW